MKRKHQPADDEPMRAECDFTHAVRGKYYQRYQQGTNIVVLEPDVAVAFPTSEAVNDALRSLLRVARRSAGIPSRPVRKRASAAGS